MAKRKPLSPEHRAKISAAHKGRPKSLEVRAKLSAALKEHEFSLETRAKISATLTGRKTQPCPPEKAAKIAAAQSGENGHNWAGDQVGYMGIHKRARVALPHKCELADETCKGGLQVALRPNAEGPLKFDERRQLYYSSNIDDYHRLCKSHHNRVDGMVPPVRRKEQA